VNNKLTKDERKALKIEFLKKSESVIYRKANRIFWISVFGIIFALAVTVFDIYYQTGIINYILNIFLLIFTAFCAYRTSKIKKLELNKHFSIKNTKSKNLKK